VDAETIELARRGDRRAQARLLSALQDVWYRFCLSQLRDADKAADATQETALRFLKQLSNFRGDSQLQTWSLGIALNVVREMRRKRSADSLEEDPQIAAEQSFVGSSSEDTEEKQKMRSILQTLPDRQREALVLRFFEEMSVEQTAAAMNCAVGTVKATVHQALRALRQKMGQAI
jgi:RNA polymerase sigma-70 factor (ECF subfamily)